MVQPSERLISTDAERYLLIYMIAVLILVTALIITFFIVFLKRKNKLLLDKIKREQEFQEELSKTQLEIQEQTLKNIGWELHDNVGQLLSFASMQLNLLSSQVDEGVKKTVEDTKGVISDSINEVRALSRSLNNDVILNLGLKQSIQNEVNRLNKLKKIDAELLIKGEEQPLKNPQDEIILFRILQEFLSNTIKYSEADKLSIALDYTDDHLNISAEDNGKGFDINTITQGSGLINMNSRAELIHTNFKLDSSPGEGVRLRLQYPMTVS